MRLWGLGKGASKTISLDSQLFGGGNPKSLIFGGIDDGSVLFKYFKRIIKRTSSQVNDGAGSVLLLSGKLWVLMTLSGLQFTIMKYLYVRGGDGYAGRFFLCE
ncbi:hypothetical protein M8C21_009303 [Ambrosia artemisiifolia]|uniref:Uncharacterized protein n=1 Tax=Ambrosia artemisiifolia TaxID=4212 RepID=A0AAD5GMP1_AMBAR|nr:hypothetical protein M8C21_009303 [Ambrosia artemisiifolia]